jgi:hypothetical protein
MQLVQTTIFLTRPFESVRTRCKFGLNLRLVTLWAWLILWPTIGFLPHISHIRDIAVLLILSCLDPMKGYYIVCTKPKLLH